MCKSRASPCPDFLVGQAVPLSYIPHGRTTAMNHRSETTSAPDSRTTPLSRRTFLSAVGTGLVGASLAPSEEARGERKKMAIVTTEWRYGCHAWHMGERFLVG